MGLPMSMARILQQLLSAKRIGTFLLSQDVDYLNEMPLGEEAVPKISSLYIIGTVAWDIPHQADNKDVNNSTFELRDLDIHFPHGEVTLIAGKFGSGKSLLLLAMLGEARLLHGKISYAVSPIMDPNGIDDMDWSLASNRVAYVPQVRL